MTGMAEIKKIAKKRFLNLGCGQTFHPDWVNVDFSDHGGAVIAYNLRLGIPFPDDTFDVVYHSHVLEHFNKDEGGFFIAECFRVLRPGGLLRVVVPDLENITRAYLHELDAARQGSKSAMQRLEWMRIEMLDQMSREKSGGKMLEYWRQNPMPQEDFVLHRMGQEAEKVIRQFRALPASPNRNKTANTPLPPVNPDIAGSGELHRWMYDEVILKNTLEEHGFSSITRQLHNTSLIDGLPEYGLDLSASGSPRKPDSLFMEALKPVKAATTPRVAIFSSADSGGAGIAALRLQQGLQDIKFPAPMYVGSKKTASSNVHLGIGKGQAPLQTPEGYALLPACNKGGQFQKIQLAKYPGRPAGLEYFSFPWDGIKLQEMPFSEDLDIIHLHWIANFFDLPANAEAIGQRPVVWTLHDMRPFTGGCHYADGCRGFEKNCGACPQLGSNDPQDASFQAWRAQMAACRKMNLHIVCPSQWLADEAKKSALFKKFPVHHIRYAQPLEIFKPLKKEPLRAAMGIAEDELALAFSSQELGNKRKGTEYLLQCLQILAQSPLGPKLHLLLLGNRAPDAFLKLGVKVQCLGHINNPEDMAIFYNAVDAVIVPSLEDNSPNVICEAAGCGIPVVAFAAGGIPEMIKHKETGWLAPLKDAAALAEGVIWAHAAKRDPALRLRCRTFALENWNPAERTAEYVELYNAIKVTS